MHPYGLVYAQHIFILLVTLVLTNMLYVYISKTADYITDRWYIDAWHEIGGDPIYKDIDVKHKLCGSFVTDRNLCPVGFVGWTRTCYANQRW